MKSRLREDLARFAKMAFVRAADCSGLIKRYWKAKSSFVKSTVEDRGGRGRTGTMEDRGWDLLERIYRWVRVPFTVWPVDMRGLGLQLVEWLEQGQPVDERARSLCSLVEEPPSKKVCGMIGEYEHAVKAGNYEGLIAAPYKFETMERELAKNEEFKAEWERVKRVFEVDKFRNANGIIRRRPVQERNFRPANWRFSWETEQGQFELVFDAFCHRWNLYGIEGRREGRGQRAEVGGQNSEKWEDRPLLLKLTVNLTAYSTIIEIPRYWSFDPKRDLKWGAITRLHRLRGVGRQGPKLSAGRVERHEEGERARSLWEEATRAGLKGQRRSDWVMGRLGWDARTDESSLRRVMGK